MYSMLCATPMACSVALTSAWKLLTSVLCTCRRQALCARTRRSEIACRGRLRACSAMFKMQSWVYYAATHPRAAHVRVGSGHQAVRDLPVSFGMYSARECGSDATGTNGTDH